MRYRPDVDGLRAVAVVPVVLYHSGRWLPGGFVGVDIFFVISGFLITQLLSEEIEAGKYSITRFYVRRARRIFPALFFMFACCSAFTLLEFLPTEIANFKDSLIAATLFVSNFHFYLTEDYFAPQSNALPLLHTWSLAVEEQFYVVFPLLLVLLRKKAAALERWILTILALLSLLTAAHLVASDRSSAAFYLPQSRAWELLAGSLIALNAVPAMRHKVLANIAATAGMGFILYSVLTYSHRTDFPGFAALLPCVGAALVIYAGKTTPTLVSRLLALPPIRFIGLISYSLYLWHWPIFVGLRLFPDLPKHLGIAVSLAASFAAAVLSWRFIERPFRQPITRYGYSGSLAIAGGTMCALTAIAFLLPPSSELRWRLSPQETAILAMQGRHFDDEMRVNTCFLTAPNSDLSTFDQKTCLRRSNTKPNYILVGDSHAADLWPGLSQVNPDVNLMQATASGCTPVIGNSGRTKRCSQLLHFVFEEYLPCNHVEGILLSGRWSAETAADARATIDILARYADHVVLLGPSPVYQHSLPRTVVISMRSHDPSRIPRDVLDESRLADVSLAARMRGSPASYFSIYQSICPANQCQVLDSEGLPMLFDTDHFTLNGSITVARQIRASGILGLTGSSVAKSLPSPL